MNLSNLLLGRMVAQRNNLPMAGGRHKQWTYPIRSSDTIQIRHGLESQTPELLEYLNLKSLLCNESFYAGKI